MGHKPLTEIIPWRKTFWVKNYAKTITTTTLVSSGIGLLITGLSTRMSNRGFSDVELQVGTISIILAILITLIIDKWAEKKKKEELTLIDKTIDDRARKIAEEKVLEYLDEIGGD
jgi:uncharacterized protein YacL